MKANKDKVTYANAGIGAASHLCGMLFMSAIGTDVLTVPYKGTGPAMNDLVGGQVDFMCDQTTSTTGQIKGGKVKVYGITSRASAWPRCPTCRRSTSRASRAPTSASGTALYAPKGTPKPVLDKLVAAMQDALKDPGVQQQVHRAGRGHLPGPTSRRRRRSGAPQGGDRQVGADHQEGGRLRRLSRRKKMPLAVWARGKPLSEEKRRLAPTFSLEQQACHSRLPATNQSLTRNRDVARGARSWCARAPS